LTDSFSRNPYYAAYWSECIALCFQGEEIHVQVLLRCAGYTGTESLQGFNAIRFVDAGNVILKRPVRQELRMIALLRYLLTWLKTHDPLHQIDTMNHGLDPSKKTLFPGAFPMDVYFLLSEEQVLLNVTSIEFSVVNNNFSKCLSEVHNISKL